MFMKGNFDVYVLVTFGQNGPKLNSTLRSLLNELAGLTIVTIVKPASSFNRDLRVPCVL